jgi:NADH-quinone oxidoreductase subunit M
MVKRVVFGDVANENVAKLEDINGRETFILGSLAFAVLALGMWPEPLVDVMEVSLANLLQHITVTKIP